MHYGVFLQGAPGKDGDTGAPGAPGPGVCVFKHLRVQYDVNLLWQCELLQFLLWFFPLCGVLGPIWRERRAGTCRFSWIPGVLLSVCTSSSFEFRLVPDYRWFSHSMEVKLSLFILSQGLPGTQGATGETGKPGDQVIRHNFVESGVMFLGYIFCPHSF